MAELLVLRGVSKSYLRGRRRLPVLADVSLTVGAKEIVAVVGSRPVGKSTLLKIACGLEQPDNGEVWLGGCELVGSSGRERERVRLEQIAWVSREDGGLGFEMLDYVSLPLWTRGSGDSEDTAMAALERVGVSASARRRWEELSDWERVLVALARGIVGRPSLLVIDDLLGNLGASKTEEAGELLRSLVDELGCGVLMSASDVEATLLADRVWLFADYGLSLLVDHASRASNVSRLIPRERPPETRGSGALGS